jgi:conjugal transfer/entry exclusion protein
MRRTLLIALVVVGLWTSQVHAQGLPVIDISNLLQNTVQAVQSVLMVANMVLELTPLGEIVLSDTFGSDLDELAGIVREAQGMSYDLNSLNAQITTLFDLSTAPSTSRALQQRLAAIRQVVVDSYVYALRTQTLIRTALNTVQHLTRLVAAIEHFAGNMAANQTLTQLDSKLTQTLTQLQVQTAAYERAQSVERLTEPLIIESLQRINKAGMEDYPQ